MSDGSNRLDRRSDFCRFTVWYKTSSGWDVIYCVQRITGCSATGHSGNGVRPRLREECLQAQVEHHAGAVKLTMPVRLTGSTWQCPFRTAEQAQSGTA